MNRFRSTVFFFIEIALLYTVLFFIHAQHRATEVAIPLTIALVPILAFYAHRMEKQFTVPFFVWAIGLGYIFRDSLSPLTSSPEIMSLLATIFGIFIIFGGGLELKFSSFRKMLLPIISLAVFGSIVTAFLFSFGLIQAIRWLAIPLSVGTAGLLGAILCSTDPAAIIPILKKLKFQNKNNTTVAIAESAVNDVVGTIMTAVFFSLVVGSTVTTRSLGDLYTHLFSTEVLFTFLIELAVGILVGAIAYQLLRLWRMSRSNLQASLPFFIGASLIAYVLSVLWGGSGYLAAFITGLLFDIQPEHKEIEHFFSGLVDGFVKPAVFVMLGALISSSFIEFAPIGILISALFIFCVRPIAVFASLLIFTGRRGIFKIKDLLFFNVVRETGVIPAVLLVSIAPQLPDGQAAFAIGSWIILSSLIFLPLVTTWWTKKIDVVKK